MLSFLINWLICRRQQEEVFGETKASIYWFTPQIATYPELVQAEARSKSSVWVSHEVAKIQVPDHYSVSQEHRQRAGLEAELLVLKSEPRNGKLVLHVPV